MKLLWQICFCSRERGGDSENWREKPADPFPANIANFRKRRVTVDPSCEIILNLVAWKISGFSWKFNEKSCFSSLLSKFHVNDENPIGRLRALLFGRKVLPVRLGIRYVETAPMDLSIL